MVGAAAEEEADGTVRFVSPVLLISSSNSPEREFWRQALLGVEVLGVMVRDGRRPSVRLGVDGPASAKVAFAMDDKSPETLHLTISLASMDPYDSSRSALEGKVDRFNLRGERKIGSLAWARIGTAEGDVVSNIDCICCCCSI